MRILISNDDGYKARGIHVLARLMAELGEVTVVAPKYHQSAMSMSVSLGMKRLAYKALPEEGPGDWHYLDATPASCVKFGLEYFYEHRNPDHVICGITHGSNAATAANYSATLGSAEEGALNGCKAIGVSVCDFSPDASFDLVEKYLPGIIRSLLDNWPEGRYGLLYSINFPKVAPEQCKGICFARQGRGHWEKEFQEWDPEYFQKRGIDLSIYGYRWVDFVPEQGEELYFMVGTFVDDPANTPEADHRMMKDGYVAVTVHNFDNTDRRLESRLKTAGFEYDF